MRIFELTEAKGKSKKDDKPALRNPVAKFSGEFNKAQTFKDRTKYDRKEKYKKIPEDSPEINDPELSSPDEEADLQSLTDSCYDENID